MVREGTGWIGDYQSHNPKVAGSNPAPATIENSRSGALSEESGRAFLLRRFAMARSHGRLPDLLAGAIEDVEHVVDLVVQLQGVDSLARKSSTATSSASAKYSRLALRSASIWSRFSLGVRSCIPSLSMTDSRSAGRSASRTASERRVSAWSTSKPIRTFVRLTSSVSENLGTSESVRISMPRPHRGQRPRRLPS
jgi:hypothetical protein